MAKRKRVEVKLRLNNVRVSFPCLFEPEAYETGQKPAYSGNFLLPKDHEQCGEIKQGMVKVAKATWGDNWKRVLKDLQLEKRTFFTDGDKKTTDSGDTMEGYPGNYIISGRSYVRPTVVDKNPNRNLTAEDGKIYSGCFVNVFISIWSQSGGKYGKRINCQLQGVQYNGEGESFGGGKAADPSVFETLADEFEDDEQTFDANDLLGSDDIDFDDDIPF